MTFDLQCSLMHFRNFVYNVRYYKSVELHAFFCSWSSTCRPANSHILPWVSQFFFFSHGLTTTLPISRFLGKIILKWNVTMLNKMEIQWGRIVSFKALLALCLTFWPRLVGLFGRNDPFAISFFLVMTTSWSLKKQHLVTTGITNKAR